MLSHLVCLKEGLTINFFSILVLIGLKARATTVEGDCEMEFENEAAGEN